MTCVCLCMNRGLLKAFLTVDYVGVILCFNGSCLANSLAKLRGSRRAKLLPHVCVQGYAGTGDCGLISAYRRVQICTRGYRVDESDK